MRADRKIEEIRRKKEYRGGERDGDGERENK